MDSENYARKSIRRRLILFHSNNVIVFQASVVVMCVCVCLCVSACVCMFVGMCVYTKKRKRGTVDIGSNLARCLLVSHLKRSSGHITTPEWVEGSSRRRNQPLPGISFQAHTLYDILFSYLLF